MNYLVKIKWYLLLFSLESRFSQKIEQLYKKEINKHGVYLF